MFLYLKEIGLDICPALIGAVSWMFSGYVMVWFEFEIIPILALSLPASCYFIERWFKKRTRFNALCLTSAMAVSITSGFAHVIIYQFLFIGVYVVYRYFLPEKKGSASCRITKVDLGNLGLALLLGLCISATFITSHLSMLDTSQRQGFGFEELYRQTGKLPLKYLITFIFPDFFGNPVSNIVFTPRPEGSQPYNNYNELCIYTGILSLFLSIICLPYLFTKKHVPFFLLSAVILLSMSMGSFLYYPLMKFIPGLNLSTPTRILYLFSFSFSVLAAFGADILLTLEKKQKWLIFILWSLIPLAAVSISFFVQTVPGIKWALEPAIQTNQGQVYGIFREYFAPWSLVMFKPLILIFVSFLFLTLTLFSSKKRSKTLFLILSIGVLSYDLISFGLSYNTQSPVSLAFPPTDAIRFLQKDTSKYRVLPYGKFMHNSFSPFGIEDIGGYSSFYPKRYGEFLHLSQKGIAAPLPDRFNRWIFFEKFDSPLLNLINTKYVLLPPSYSAQTPKFRLVYDKEIKIYENMDAFPRVFFVPEYQFCGSREEAYQAIGICTNSDLKQKVFLESLPPADFRVEKNLMKQKYQ
ncbi:hypothetical protein QUF76_13785 [Desulfobacterales bacterium HSG16]|nr:hypothetical protein [Desulfobacterales bacterium HSG16]